MPAHLLNSCYIHFCHRTATKLPHIHTFMLLHLVKYYKHQAIFLKNWNVTIWISCNTLTHKPKNISSHCIIWPCRNHILQPQETPPPPQQIALDKKNLKHTVFVIFCFIASPTYFSSLDLISQKHWAKEHVTHHCPPAWYLSHMNKFLIIKHKILSKWISRQCSVYSFLL